MSRGTSKTVQSSKTPSDIFNPTNFTFNQDSPFYRESDVKQDATEAVDRQMMMGWKDIPYDHTNSNKRNSYTTTPATTGVSYNNPQTASSYFGREHQQSTHMFSLGGYSTKIFSSATNNAASAFPDYHQCPEWRFSPDGQNLFLSFRSKLSYKGTATGTAVIGWMTLSSAWNVTTLQKSSLQIFEFPNTANADAVGNFDQITNVTYVRPYYKIRFSGDGLKMYLMECSGTLRAGGTNTRIFQYTLSSTYDISDATYDGYQDFNINGLFDDDDNPILNFEIVPHPEAALTSTWSMIYFFGPNRTSSFTSQCTIAVWGFNNAGRWDITNATNIGSGPSNPSFQNQLPGLTTGGNIRYVRDIFFADSGNKLFVVAAPAAGGDLGSAGYSLYGWDLTTSSGSYVDQYNIFNSTKTSLTTGALTDSFTSGVYNGFKGHDLFDGFKPLGGGGGDLSSTTKPKFGAGFGIGACFQFNSTGTRLICNDIPSHSSEAFAPRVLEYSLSTGFDPSSLNINQMIPRIGFGFQVIGVAPKETYNHKYIAWTPPSFGHSYEGQHNTGHLGFYLVEFEDNDSSFHTVDAYGPTIASVSNDANKYKIKYIPGLHPNGIISDGTTNTDLPLCARMKPDGTQLWVYTIKNKDATAAGQSAGIKYYTLSTPWDISTLSASATGSFSFNPDSTGLYTDLKPRDYVYMWFNNTGTQLCMSNMPFENADQTQLGGSVLLINLPQPWALSPGLASVERVDNLKGSSGTFWGQEGTYVTAAEFSKDGKALWFQLDPIGASLNTGERSSLNLLHLDTPNDITTINTSNDKKLTAYAKSDIYFGYEPRSPSIGRSATSSDGVTVALDASPRYSGWGYPNGRPPANYSHSIAIKSGGSAQYDRSQYSGFSVGEDTNADSYRGLPLGMWDSGFVFSPDGRYVYTNDIKYIYQFSLERPFDLQSRYKYSGYNRLEKDNSGSGYGEYEAYGASVRPIAFSADGTKVFWTRMYDQDFNRLSLYSRDLSIPWDISSTSGPSYNYWTSSSTFSGSSGGDTGGIGQYEVVAGFGGMTHFEFSPDGTKVIMNWTFSSGPSYQRYYQYVYKHTQYFVLSLDQPYTLPDTTTDGGLSTLAGISTGDFSGDYSTVFTMNSTGDKILSFDPIYGTANSFSLNTPYVFGSSLNSTIASKQMYPFMSALNREHGPLTAQAYMFCGLARVGVDKLMLVRSPATKAASWTILRDGNTARRTRQNPVDIIDLNGTYGFMG